MRNIFWDVDYIPYEERSGILVTLGGSGDQWCLSSILREVSKLSSEKIIVLTAGNNFTIDQNSDMIVISEHKNPEEMMNLIKYAKIIICGGGGTLIEAARCGTPAIIVEMADNQKNNIKAWTENGFARFAGHKTNLGLGEAVATHVKSLSEPFAWIRSSFIGIEKVDGQGARRIAELIISEVEGLARSVHLKKDYQIGDLYLKNYINCSPDEHRAIIEARNTESIRRSSVNQKIITDEMHELFIRSLNSSVTGGYWLIYDDEITTPLGVISITGIDYNDSSGSLGYYKFPKRTEKGVGKRLLVAAKEVVFKNIKLTTFFAECIETNIPSIRAMEAAGFTHIRTSERVIGCGIENVRFYVLNSMAEEKI
jgi:UDP-4-amino-4,6-dideoxy-N-acetyl-beta-L-altrosamine N-acetyltransferase